jgi:hypothetical protein
MNLTFSNTTSTSSDPNIIPDDLGVFILCILLIIVMICVVLKNKHNCDDDDPYKVARARHRLISRHQPELVSI